MSSNIVKPLIGGHVSTAGGLIYGIKNGEAIHADCLQIFGAPPRQYAGRMPDTSTIKEYLDALKKSEIKAVYLHASYLVNLASASTDNAQKSIKSLTDHLNIANAINADGLIFHLGSYKDKTKKEGLNQEVEGMKEILKNVKGDSYLVMENSALGGEKIGDIEDLEYLFKKVNSKKVKICLDMAHIFEAGILKFEDREIKEFFDDFDNKIGIENLVVIHANDSKTEFGSHHDKHDNIGEGKIGLPGFKNLAKEKRLWDKPWLLEVPGFNGEGPDKKNVDILRKLFG